MEIIFNTTYRLQVSRNVVLKMISIYGVSIVLLSIKLLSGNRNLCQVCTAGCTLVAWLVKAAQKCLCKMCFRG